MLENLTMERKKSEAAVIKDNIAEDLCSLNKKKNSLCLLSASGRKKSWREKEYLSDKGITNSKGMGIKVLQGLPIMEI